LNALNPSATPSTFAPQFSAPARTSILIGPVGPLYKIVPTPRRRRVARMRRQTQAADRQPRRPSVSRASPPASEPAHDWREQHIMGSICRGC
jgi:hypothetical protein